jgi:hypothetical protein
MHLNWLSILSAVLAFTAFFVTYRTAKKITVRKRILLSPLALIAAIPGVSFSLYYAHILPETAWYYEFRSHTGTEFLVVFIGIAGGLIATLLPRVLLIIPLLGVAAFSIVPMIKPIIGPIKADALYDKWDDKVCLQSTGSTCGAASTATILKHFGIIAKESEIAAEAHSYAGGTEAWYLARSVRSRGLDANFDFTNGFNPEGGLPAVVGVKLGLIGHFIAVLGLENDKFVVGDPLRGRELLSREELHARYVFTGFHMRVKKQDP